MAEVYDFGKRLQQSRKNKKMSQDYVAKRLGVHRQIISSYERNTVTPSYETLRMMAVMYEASIDYIAGLTDRKSIYLDDMTPSQQALISDFVEKLKIELKY